MWYAEERVWFAASFPGTQDSSLCILLSMMNLSTSNKNVSVTTTTRKTQTPESTRETGWRSKSFLHKMLWSQNYNIHKGLFLQQKTLFYWNFPHVQCFFKVNVLLGSPRTSHFTFADSRFSILINLIITKTLHVIHCNNSWLLTP